MFKKVQFFESFFLKRVQFFEFLNFLKEKSHIQKMGSILWVIFKKKFNSLSHTPKRRRFHAQKKKQFFELHSKKVQFFESEKEKFNSYWEEVHKRGSIQWVIYKEFNSLSHCWNKQKGSILWVIFWDGIIFKKLKKNLDSTKKKAQFFESNGWKKSSILWVQCKKGSTLSVKFKKVFNTLSHFLWKNSTLWVVLIKKRVQFESCKKVIQFQFLEHFEKINSLSHIGKQERFKRHIEKKDFNSLSHIEKRLFQKGSIPFFKSHSLSLFLTHGSILWVIFLDQMFQFFASYERKRCSTLRHIQRKGFNSLRRIERKRVQLFAYLKKGLKSLTHIKKFNSLSHTKKTPILWLILNKKVQFFEPYLKKSSILWVLKKSVLRVKKGSILWVMFLFASDIFKKVPFFESDFFFKKKKLCIIFLRKNSILWVIIFWKEFNVFDYLSDKKFQFLSRI